MALYKVGYEWDYEGDFNLLVEAESSEDALAKAEKRLNHLSFKITECELVVFTNGVFEIY